MTEKLGFVISRIETLSFLTGLDLAQMRGDVILNISYIPEERLADALEILAPVFSSAYVMSDRIVIKRGGERIGDVLIPEGKAGIGTVCSVTINGVFLKAGIPVTSRFGGIVEVRGGAPARFISLISYEGSSVDPLEIFIKARMTDVRGAAAGRAGSILASFREVPVVCAERAHSLAAEMAESGIGGILLVGDPNKPLLEMPVGIDRVGMVVVGGLNPIAALEESGIATESKAMSTLYEYSLLGRFGEIRGNV